MDTQIKKITTIHAGKYRDLVAAEFVTPKNTTETYEYLHDPAQTAIILPITSSGSIVTIDEYRVPTTTRILSLPGGSFDPNTEESIVCARRELQEESGYTASELFSIGTFFGAPAISDRKVEFFVAFGAYLSGDAQFDDNEDIAVAEYTYEELQKILLNKTRYVHINIFAAYEMARIKFPEKFSH